MEIMKIGTDALKVTLEPKEAREFKLLEDRELTGKEVKEVFSIILKVARERLGYRYSGEKMYADLFENKNGGCEIFVSNANKENEMYKEKSIQSDIKRVRSVINVFSFESMDRMLAICLRLKQIGYNGKSAVYYDEIKSKYYITLEDVSIKELKYAFMCEFSKMVKGNISSYLKEHCKCICKDNAIKIFAELY